jgi:hypothetical protein
MLIGRYLISGGIFYAVRYGKLWTKILLLLILVYVSAVNLIYFKPLMLSLHIDRLFIIDLISIYGSGIWASVLLFSKPVSAIQMNRLNTRNI